MSETPAQLDHLGLPLGACNQEIYGGLLGMSADDIDALTRKGVI